MIYLIYAFSSVNLYFGVWFFLNVTGVIQTSKYSHLANVCFALILITTALLALYVSVVNDRTSFALLIDGAPWIITALLLIGSVIFGDSR